jgi:predicted component of type VI protein secretion system
MTTKKSTIAVLLCTALMAGCGGGGGNTTPPPPQVTVSVAAVSAPINTGASHTFTASVKNSSNQGVAWSVVEAGGGSITQSGVYTAPATPGTYTVKATALADSSASGTAAVPVVIAEGHIAGYDVGVDYHATGADFLHTAFITIYDQASVRQTVRTQLQGMADRGATVISTRIWLVTEPGTSNFGETWRATFPLSDQEQTNLHTYVQDVAAIQGSGGNRLRLDICLLWLGAADYTMGTSSTGLGFTPVTGAVFTSRVQTTTDKVLAAVTGVNRPDGVPVVDIIYLNGEVMIGVKANEDWFMTTHYPRFVSVVKQAGFTPAIYFIVADTQDDVLQNDYVDVDYPILNNHRSMFWVYRTMKFMFDQQLPIPARIDFSYYVPSTGATYPELLSRVLDDADATLPSLGASQAYAAAETFYFQDATQLLQFGQAFASEAASNTRLHSVTFWTTPDGGGSGIDMFYPFAFEDYLPPPPPAHQTAPSQSAVTSEPWKHGSKSVSPMRAFSTLTGAPASHGTGSVDW